MNFPSAAFLLALNLASFSATYCVEAGDLNGDPTESFRLLSEKISKDFSDEGIRRLFADRGPDHYDTTRRKRKILAEEKPAELGMSADDVRYIFHYTSSGYHEMNYALRNPGQMTRSLRDEVNRTIRALSKAEKYSGYSYRGVCLSPRVAHRYSKFSAQITELAFTSTDLNPVLAYRFSKLGENCIQIVFMVDGVSGRNISWASAQTGEDEILFLPNSRFRVDFVDEHAHGAVMIGLTEIPNSK
jgi:hypothetical protein